MRGIEVLRWRWATAAALGLFILSALPGLARAENRKHHLGFALGYEKHLSDDLKQESIGIDYTDAGYGASSRLSVLANLDLTLDARGTTQRQHRRCRPHSEHRFLRPIRLIAPNEGLRPYMRATSSSAKASRPSWEA
jgi:hypothetical protein